MLQDLQYVNISLSWLLQDQPLQKGPVFHPEICKNDYFWDLGTSWGLDLRKCVISVAFSPPPVFFVYFLLVLPLSVSTFRLFEFGFHCSNFELTFRLLAF